MKIEAGEGYRLLELGEIIMATDEVFSVVQDKWVAAVISVGTDVRFPSFRRKLPVPAPTGWIKCSERLPDGKGPIWLFQSGERPIFSRAYMRADLVGGGWTHWQPAVAPAPPAPPEPPEPEKSKAEKAADRYVEGLLAPLDRNNAKKDFLAGWKAGKL